MPIWRHRPLVPPTSELPSSFLPMTHQSMAPATPRAAAARNFPFETPFSAAPALLFAPDTVAAAELAVAPVP
jgi:hypothetical protein